MLCGVLVFLAAPPRSSSSVLLPPSSFLLSIYNLSHTTSLTTTSLASPQHHSDNIPHTTHNITHTTSDAKGSDDKTSLREHPTHRQHPTHNTQHHSHNIGCTTSHTPQCADFVAGAVVCEPPCADLVAGTALCCLPTGRMYALASSGVVWAPAQISWQAQYFAACQGVGCTPWRRLASAGHRRRFRGRCSTLLLAKGSDVRPGVVWRRLGTSADFVAGAVLCCLPRGRMYALASSGVGWAPAQFAWQAQYFAARQGVGCTPWRRLASAGHQRGFRGRCSTLLLAKGSDVRPGVIWRRLGTGADFVAGAVLCCLPRGRMYALASSGVGWAPAQFAWQAQYFAARQGVGCTPWRRLASSGVGWAPAQFAWQAQHFAACQGVGCTPWRRLGTGADFVAGAALCCLPRGRMYALASSGVAWAPAQISWQAQYFAACQGVGCTPWRRLASAGHRRSLRGRRSTLLHAKGSDVRPGVVWRRLGTGADFVAGTALCEPPCADFVPGTQRLWSWNMRTGDFVVQL